MDIDELLEKGFNYQIEYIKGGNKELHNKLIEKEEYKFIVRINKKLIYEEIITHEEYKLQEITNYFIRICKEYIRKHYSITLDKSSSK